MKLNKNTQEKNKEIPVFNNIYQFILRKNMLDKKGKSILTKGRYYDYICFDDIVKPNLTNCRPADGWLAVCPHCKTDNYLTRQLWWCKIMDDTASSKIHCKGCKKEFNLIYGNQGIKNDKHKM